MSNTESKGVELANSWLEIRDDVDWFRDMSSYQEIVDLVVDVVEGEDIEDDFASWVKQGLVDYGYRKESLPVHTARDAVNVLESLFGDVSASDDCLEYMLKVRKDIFDEFTWRISMLRKDMELLGEEIYRKI